MYLRYVDDIFAVFSDDNSCSRFFETLNSQHPNIKFTCETGPSSLSFLDVKIVVNENGTDTFVWRKPTNTNLLLNFNAFCPSRWKCGLILCLLNRAKLICSSHSLFLNEVQRLRSIFCSNGYPVWFFNKVFRRFQVNDKPKLVSHNEYKYFVKLPYFGKVSQRFANQLSKIVRCKFNTKISPLYSSFKVGKVFQLKDKTPLPLRSNVVYRFTCSCDTSKSYIGMTSRHLITRVKEHLDLGDLHTKSAIKDHIYNCNSCSSFKQSIHSFSILRQCNNDYDAKIHEALLIKRLKPELNKQMYSNGTSFLLNIF